MSIRAPTTSSSSTLSYLAGDQLGSVSVALSTSGTATAQALYSPYGTIRYASGSMPTAHGYTGQLADGMTGLDYYGARYYDPALGQFTTADTVLAGGLNRYAYVKGNPTTRTDPSGHELEEELRGGGGGEGEGDGTGDGEGDGAGLGGATAGAGTGSGASASGVSTATVGGDVTSGDVTWTDDGQSVTITHSNGTVTVEDASLYGGDPADLNQGISRAELNAQQQAAEADQGDQDTQGTPGNPGTTTTPTEPASTQPSNPTEPASTQPSNSVEPPSTEGNGNTAEGCGESFAPSTLVTTPNGTRPIATLAVGGTVEAYDPTTGKSSVQTVQHVFVDHDTDLLDVTLRVVQPASATPQPRHALAGGSPRVGAKSSRTVQQERDLQPQEQAGAQNEVVHTTASHPWLTADQGWVRAGTLQVGEQVVRADGGTAMVVALHVVPGAANMWDLTVSNVHTFVVGAGTYVVHNCAKPVQPINVNGGKATVQQALTAAERLLGPGYREIAPGVFRSADDFIQFRMTTSDLTDPVQGPHVHFEIVDTDGSALPINIHVYLMDP